MTPANTLPRPAWGCRYECGGYWLICKCGAWNSHDYQVQNRCYMCSKKLLRDRTEVVDDIAKLESALVGLRAELETYPKTINEVRNEMDKNTIDKKDWPPVRTPPPPADLGKLATEGELVKLRTWLWKLRNTAKSALTQAQQEVDAYLRALDPPAQKPAHKAGENNETPEEEASMRMHAELHEKHPEMYEPRGKHQLKHGVHVVSLVNCATSNYNYLRNALEYDKYFNCIGGRWTAANEVGVQSFASEAHAIRFALRMGWDVLSTPTHYHDESTRIKGEPGGLVQAYGACKCGGAVATGGTPYEDIWRQHMEEVSAPTVALGGGGGGHGSCDPTVVVASGGPGGSGGEARVKVVKSLADQGEGGGAAYNAPSLEYEEMLRQRSLARLKGACAFAHGFPITAEHGYAGENARAWKYGYEYCRDYLRVHNAVRFEGLEKLWSSLLGAATACTKEVAFSFAQSYAEHGEALLKFKQYVHDRLDKAGVDRHEEQNAINGCRIGARLTEVLRPPIGFVCHAAYCGATGNSSRRPWRESDVYLCTCGLATYLKARRAGGAE